MTMPTGGTPPPITDELLSAYLDGQLSPAERDAVAAAIAADPAVRTRAADLRATVALLRSLPQPAPRRTFILTPEQAAAIRPMRVPWITRLFPAVAAASAVAAVLCLALIVGDRTTGGFSTKKQATTARPAIESVSNATTTGAASAALAPTTAPAATTAAVVATAALPASVPLAAATTAPAAPAPAAAAAIAPGTIAAGSAASARSQSATSIGATAIAPTAPSGAIIAAQPLTPTTNAFTASTATSPAKPTTVANAQAPQPPVSPAPASGATVPKETHRVPVPLVRAGEILLALLALAGIMLAAFGWRRSARRA